jgi:hypothetical protein
MRGGLASIVLVIVLTISGCLAVSVDGKSHRGYGPPPHAPAHGYRYHYQGAILAFDAKLGVYLVVDHPHHFYSDGRFLRVHAGSWQVSSTLAGPWHPCAPSSLPPGLRKPHGHKAAKRHGPKTSPPAKGDW